MLGEKASYEKKNEKVDANIEQNFDEDVENNHLKSMIKKKIIFSGSLT